METDRSLLGESRTGFLSHRECIEEEYEYANEFGKQGRKNPRNNISKFTINHERFSRAIEKKEARNKTAHPYFHDVRTDDTEWLGWLAAARQ